ncbi:cryptochrome dash-like [Plakobranchus ocellatus]|uniref:Cryptochrome DASH n=1 Tax=Plakobranchus ocellatus TaxID=259542 RepID=A0AAV4AJP5_9GAST|nr:cryptochrome dash-like [Plakobranchus ocellatus]
MAAANLKYGICLFRNDIRVHDNEALFLANQRSDFLIPLYCFDPRHFKGTYHFGFPKTGHHRACFMIDSVQDLRSSLQSLGSNLLVRQGKPEQVVLDLIRSLDLKNVTVFLQDESMDEEKRVENAIRSKSSVSVTSIWGHTLYHVEDLPFQPKHLPDVYTEFRKRVEGRASIRKCFTMPPSLKPLPTDLEEGNIPTMSDLGLPVLQKDERSVFPFKGGESSGLNRLQDYLWGTDHVSTYKETRNGMIGSDYSTKFSPWLAHGCISPRKIYWEIKKYENERTSNQSTYWVIFELIWRDYFRFVGLKYGNQLFHPGGIRGNEVNWRSDNAQFSAWKEGKTGVPYVDANMRELAATGFMSNRGRQNVASFLTKDLKLDWRLGAEWFESLLLDHDVCSNYGNWLYSAGLGNDPRENRKFNVVKQGLDYDGDGDYVRLWLPELAGVKTGKVHCVWTLSPSVLEAANVSLGETYPSPVVMAPEWSRHVNRPTSSMGSGKGRTGAPGSARGKGQGSSSYRGHGSQAQYPGQKRGIDFYFSSSNKR